MKFLFSLVLVIFFACKLLFAGCSVPKPAGLQVASQTTCSATLSWSASTNASYYVVWYEKKGSTVPITLNVGNVTTYTVTGLSAKTQYQYKVAAYCANNASKGYSPIVKATTLRCSGVTNVSVSSVTQTSVVITWIPECNSSKFYLRYKSSTSASWSTLSNILTTSATISALTSGIQYEVQVRSQCGKDTSLWSSSVFFTTVSGTTSAPRPNILFIFEDDGRFDTFPSTGGPSFFETPSINSIANEGVNFKITIPATSQCTPSRCSVYTGLYPHKHGAVINGADMNPGLPLVQQILHDNGYFTGFLGKYGQAGPPQGFDWYAKSNSLLYNNPDFQVNGVDVNNANLHYTDVIQKYALQFLDSVPEGKPFMLMYFTIIPHSPTVPRLQESTLYADDTMPFPSNFSHYTTNYPSFLYGPRTNWPEDSLVTDSMRRIEFECVKGLDYSVDTLLQYLSAKGILDSTMVIFSSDNGYLKGEHLLDGKEMIYEESIRVPLFIRYPKWFAPGSVIEDEIASNIDIGPTMLEAAGVSDTFHMDGVSLHDLYNHIAERKDFLYEFPVGDGLPAIRAVRSLRYMYSMNYCTSSTEEFYDLLTDPKEDTNQILNPSYASTIALYRQKLDSLRTAFNDVTLDLTTCSLVSSRMETFADEDFPASVITMPNPCSDHFLVRLYEEIMNIDAVLSVYDLTGRIVDQKRGAENPVKFDCSRWNEGNYLIEVRSQSQTSFSKITVDHH